MKIDSPHFWAQSVEETIETLSSSTDGLSTTAAQKRLQEFGKNQLPEQERSLLLLFLKHWNDILVYILLVALIVSAALPFFEHSSVRLSDLTDAIAILIILLLNASLGFIQEYKADQATRALAKLSSPAVRVRREGREEMIPSEQLVPGDILVLEAGDRLSADAKVISATKLATNESSLTGESTLVWKSSPALEPATPLAERKNMVMSGSFVAEGIGEAIVTSTGVKTELGQIADLMRATAPPITPLQKSMFRLSRILGQVVLTICFVLLVIGTMNGQKFLEMLLLTLSVAVAAVPEGLPAVVTVCFALGVRQMAKKNALVRRLNALETLGSVTVICSDKTGTITQNQMEVIEVWPGQEASQAKQLVQVAASCCRAQLPDIGDPTELGILRYAEREQIEVIPIDSIPVPFNSEHKYMATKHGQSTFYKGALESIDALMTNQSNLSQAYSRAKKLSQKGLRVLAVAKQDGQEEFEFLGLIGLADPPREGVFEAIQTARRAGIRAIMITGDGLETAEAIAREIGITGGSILGADLAELSPEELSERVMSTSVFARVAPEHKLLILDSLRARGEIVSMSGDGVNDAPALRGAHVGIAMGRDGTEVAREAGSIILTDDHFGSIVAAIREGRRIYDNIRKFTLFLLRANAGELLLISLAMLTNQPLPLLPVHILWINLATDSLPALALSVEQAENNIMNRPPRARDEHLLSGEFPRLLYSAVLVALPLFFLFKVQIMSGVQLESARTVTLSAAIALELFFVFSARSIQPIWRIGVFSNPLLVWAVAVPFVSHLIVLVTPLRKFLHLSPISLESAAVIVITGLFPVLVYELTKNHRWLTPKSIRKGAYNV